jgi:hypothetical protein
VSSASASRAYANQLTGSLHLLDLPSNTLFEYVLKTRLPEVFRPSFLHEATHFWCEATDLGAALACLELRAQRDSLLETVDQSRFLHDVGVVDAARLLLTPLLEGMALFQEFDAFPGSSRVWADPSLWAGMLFVPVEESIPEHMSHQEVIDWLSGRIYDTIGRYRTSATAVRRKTETLMQTISGDPHFYLSGYLAVKQIWFSAAMKTPAFLDRDLFLSFLRCWVFQDWGLITEVLNEDWSPALAATFVSERLQDRLRELAVTDLTDEAAIYERVLNTEQPDHEALIGAMHLNPAATQAAVGRLREMIGHVYEGLARGGEWENFYFSDVVTLRHRQEMMRLALEKVQIEVNEFQRVLVRKGPTLEDTYMAGPAPEGAAAGITPGWIAVYFLPRLQKMLTIAVRSNQAMIWLPAQLGIPADESRILQVAITKVIATEEARHGLHVACRDVARSFRDDSYMELAATLPAHVAQLYLRFALSFVREGHDSSVQEMLEKKGLYTLLGRDGDLLTALAAISLHPGCASREHVRRILADYDLDADWAFDELEAIVRRTGAQIVLMTADGDMWCRT